MTVPAAAIIVAAGRGQRFGGGVPKCFVPLAGKPMFLWSLEAFYQAPVIHWIALVVPPGLEKVAASHLPASAKAVPTLVLPGGSERWQSAAVGIEAVARFKPDVVAIHDGARPLVTPDLISRCIAAAGQAGAAIAAVPATDTLKRVRGGRVVGTLDRACVWHAQTPQAFRTDVIEQAYSRAREQKWRATDDAGLVEKLGIRPAVVQADPHNLKITTPSDLIVAEALLRDRHTI
ncbi:MAG: 2-C-methyl-D-erythritol 4-phosphate cytidylyltransferase [Armatimonadetes bacterium]|nr:2-C-methyl-D-erythritol 4-phosphate cytidylyltransferase [Armatimonadota bacterium]